MKLLVAGDFHGDSSSAVRLAKRASAEKVDIVLLCGDIVEMNTDSKNLIKPFADAGKKVILIPGNHDGFAVADFLADMYNVRNLHGYSAVYGDVGLFGCGGANIGLEALSEEEIFSILKKGFERVKNLGKKIMVTHVFPSGSLMDKMSHTNLIGSAGVRKALLELKPDILFCSHAHEAEGVEERIGNTNVICVGRNGRIVEV